MPLRWDGSPIWAGELVVVCGAGPSLTQTDLDLCHRQSPRPKLIVVNNAWRIAPWADALFAADRQWWDWNVGVPDSALPPFIFATQPTATCARPTVQLLRACRGDGISTDPLMLVSGGHSGHQAINLAVQFGARAILLLGFDMGPSRDGRHHFHPEHPNGTHPTYHARLRAFKPLRAALDALHIPIINCSRQTAIRTLDRLPLEVALERYSHDNLSASAISA